MKKIRISENLQGLKNSVPKEALQVLLDLLQTARPYGKYEDTYFNKAYGVSILTILRPNRWRSRVVFSIIVFLFKLCGCSSSTDDHELENDEHMLDYIRCQFQIVKMQLLTQDLDKLEQLSEADTDQEQMEIELEDPDMSDNLNVNGLGM